MQAVTELLYKHFDKPALVIGGGPSVLADLPLLGADYFSAVISANDHGFKQSKFRVDYVVNVDKRHSVTQEYMRHRLARHNTPVINSHSWADYRLLDWRFTANSGITAIAVAVALGCNPVVATGIDCWGGELYFHNPAYGSTRAPGQKFKSYYIEQMSYFVRSRCGLYGNLRALSGPVKEKFGEFHPDELLPKLDPHPYRMDLLSKKPVRVRALKAFEFSRYDTVTAGTILTLSPRELCMTAPRGAVERLQD